MALIHKNSCECVKFELDLFGVSPTITSVEVIGNNWKQLLRL